MWLSVLDCTLYYLNLNLAGMVAKTNYYQSTGKVDATSNMANDRVFIFSGTYDTTVLHGNTIYAFAVMATN